MHLFAMRSLGADDALSQQRGQDYVSVEHTDQGQQMLTYSIVCTLCEHVASNRFDSCAICRRVPGHDTKCHHKQFL